MGMDQAAGLRKWATNNAPHPPPEECPRHVAEALVELASTGKASAAPRPAPPRPEAAARPAATSRHESGLTLMVLGLPGSGERHTRRVSELLEHWAREGRRWVGDPRAWRIVPISVASPHLPVLAGQQPRWALWVGSDAEAFRRAYLQLKRVAEQGGPSRLLLVHPPDVGRQGLLNNLQHAAASYLGIELLVLAR